MAMGEIDLRKLDVADGYIHHATELSLAHTRHDFLDKFERGEAMRLEPMVPILAGQASEICRRLANAGIGDEDVRMRTGRKHGCPPFRCGDIGWDESGGHA